VNAPMITDEMARVSRIRYSTDSRIAGRATIVPTTKAMAMPMARAGRKFQSLFKVR
jgi:hypothetical protein